MADGGSRIEVDEECHSRQRRSVTALPRIVVERAPEVEPRRFYVLEAAQDVQRLHSMEKRQSRISTNAERESERSLTEL